MPLGENCPVEKDEDEKVQQQMLIEQQHHLNNTRARTLHAYREKDECFSDLIWLFHVLYHSTIFVFSFCVLCLFYFLVACLCICSCQCVFKLQPTTPRSLLLTRAAQQLSAATKNTHPHLFEPQEERRWRTLLLLLLGIYLFIYLLEDDHSLSQCFHFISQSHSLTHSLARIRLIFMAMWDGSQLTCPDCVACCRLYRQKERKKELFFNNNNNNKSKGNWERKREEQINVRKVRLDYTEYS